MGGSVLIMSQLDVDWVAVVYSLLSTDSWISRFSSTILESSVSCWVGGKENVGKAH